MTSTVVVGGFFGDEGKGKIISYLAIKDNPKIIVRGGAGPNAGHTIRDGDKVYKVRMLPSGFLNKDAKVMIGPGVVINPDILKKEIQDFNVSGRSFIDKHCGIIEETHLTRDSKGELKEKIKGFINNNKDNEKQINDYYEQNENKQRLFDEMLNDKLFEKLKETKTTSSNLTKELKELHELYKSGALTKEEYTKAKKKLLN